jgi:hypothetical protein
MAAFGRVVLLVAVTAVQAASVTPIEKVITLLEDLKTKVETEGKEEAKTYDKFACFCKDKTKDKSGEITKSQDKIDELSASIEEGVADKAKKTKELGERGEKQAALKAELAEVTAKCDAEMAQFEADVADLTKATDSLGKAIKALKKAKGGAALLAVREEVKNSMALADALSLVSFQTAKQKGLQAFLQQGVDPDDPEYKFRSGEILDTLESMLKEFNTKLDETQEEWDKAKASCKSLKEDLNSDIETNGKAMKTLGEDIDELRSKIAEDRENLVTEEGVLSDASTYMKDLTVRCEGSAKSWDQRSSMRGDEIKALSGALAVLKKDVKDLDKKVNKRALLLRLGTHEPVLAANASTLRSANKSAKISTASPKPPSFIQASERVGLRGRMHAVQAHGGSQKRASQILTHEGIRLKSEMLSSLAVKVMADPFAKVKTLIQNLIERLLNEATAEATKQGFCNTELGKAENDRDARFSQVTKLMAELGALESKKEELEMGIEELEKAIPKAWKTLNETAALRKEEKEENLKIISDAGDGKESVGEAITILKEFYKEAGKAKMLLQASPVDEDTDGPGFEGSYRGSQESSTGIIGLLEVIKSDFDRTARKTLQAEKKAQAEFVEFDRTSRVDIKSKETQLEIDKEELKSTKAAIDRTVDDMETAQKLLDGALKTIEDLKPMCIDTGMSYKERAAKRDEEIAALKKALCALDPDKVEEECA